ncbi:hypothetical protein MSMTP_0986 [Methanosarcina sp. MTP4]|nr:hypothetical protein MSMTP_0986 [Methanosarcina sp. MTP4]
MNRTELFSTLAAGILIGIIAGGVFSGFIQEAGSEMNLKVDASDAVKIVLDNSSAREYISGYYSVPDWRVLRVTLVSGATYDLNGTELDGGEAVWKVEVLERTCACSSVSDLYVLEGYVSADTGELLDVSTRLVPEYKYEKATCSSTVCH